MPGQHLRHRGSALRAIPAEAAPPASEERFAEARRKAILNGLAQLGYEVHEGMETAWANDGQIVAKKPSLPGYGVEIGGQCGQDGGSKDLIGA